MKASPSRYYLFLAILISAALGLGLALSTRYINFWPTDSYSHYLPAARKIFSLPHLSDMHFTFPDFPSQLKVHGKEVLILGIAVMQRILHDPQSLYPNVLLVIIAVSAASILMYLVMRKFFDDQTALLAFFLLAGCFWPYQYAIMGTHVPLALMNALIAICFIQRSGEKRLYNFFAGLFAGLAIFSSPTGPMYLPYVLGVFVYVNFRQAPRPFFKKIIWPVMLNLAGVFFVALFLYYPWIYLHLRFYQTFVRISHDANHFYYYADQLKGYHFSDYMRGEGWLWILKYLWLMMPFLLVALSAAFLYVFFIYAKSRRRLFLAVLLALAGLSTLFINEFIQIAQLGRSYFSCLPGIILIVCFAFYDLKQRFFARWPLYVRKGAGIFLMFFIFSYLMHNAYIFFSDVYPSRMGTAHLEKWLLDHRIYEVATYADHPRKANIIEHLNNPKQPQKIAFRWIRSLREVNDGYVLVPPIHDKSILSNCLAEEFDQDPELTALYDSGRFNDFVVASFKTLASSKIWLQEEEICSYIDLIAEDIPAASREKGYVWVLDGKKLREEWFAGR